MNQEMYKRLARHLDQLPGGFPKTESGVELRILKRLFTEEEAELARHLTHLPEPAEAIARRANRPVEELADRIQQVSQGIDLQNGSAQGESLYGRPVCGWDLRVQREQSGPGNDQRHGGVRPGFIGVPDPD